MLRRLLRPGIDEIQRAKGSGNGGIRAAKLLCCALLVSAVLMAPSASLGQLALLNIQVSGTQTFRTALPGETNVQCFTLQLTNTYLTAVVLRSVRFTNRSTGPGTQAQLDAELGQAQFYRDDGDGLLEPGVDARLAGASAAGGTLVFAGLNVSIPAGGTVTLLVGTDIPLSARDGDNLDLSIQAPSDLTFNTSVTTSNAWPVDPPGAIAPDGMSAAQISLAPIAPASIVAGTRRNLALSVALPPNGYQADRLETLALVNDGTAEAGADLSAVEAWADDGDGILEPSAGDRRIGALLFTGDRWQLTGLAETVPTGGLPVLFSIDIDDLATEGRTVRLSFATPPTPGIGMASTNDGPLDRIVGNPSFLTISTADRIVLGADSLSSSIVAPGQTNVLLADLVFENRYSTSRTLRDLTFTNVSSGAGNVQAFDSEFDRLALRFDANGDGILGDETEDPVLGTTLFHDGEATFDPLAWDLAPGSPRRLFLTADVAIANATDGDVLGASVLAPSDLRFDDSTRVVTTRWPVDSLARALLDGMVSAQITNLGAPALTLGRGDGPALGLDVIIPRNGYADDVLDEIRIVNLGTAVDTDLAEVRFWRDGGDGAFAAGAGDDRDLGLAAWDGAGWRSAPLAEALSGPGARIFVSLVVSGSPVDSATVRLAIPIGGITCQSGDDGPLDRSIDNPNTILLSAAPLLASIEIDPETSTVGQSVLARMVVRNVGSELVQTITPSSLTSTGDGSLTLSSGPEPPSFNLAPAAADTFEWRFSAGAAGVVQLTGSAAGIGSPSGLTRRSLPSSSNVHRVFERAQNLGLIVASSMPASVNWGQAAVIPLTLDFSNSGAQTSSVRLRELRLRVEDGASSGVIPASVISQVVASVGSQVHLRKTAIEGTGAEMLLSLASPVTIDADETVALTIAIDIADSASAPSFRLAISDSTFFTAEDATSGAPVAIRLQGESFPVETGIARVVAPATELHVEAPAAAPARVGRGQASVPLLGLDLESPGLTGITSDVRVFSFSVALEDTNGAVVGRPADFLSRIRVAAGSRTLTDRPIGAAEGPAIDLALNPPLGVPANTPLDLSIEGNIADAATVGTVRLRLLDPSFWEAEDANTQDPVPAVYAVTPLTGANVSVEARADTLLARGIGRFPPRSSVGAGDVHAMTMILRHPGMTGTGRIAVDAVTLECRDEARRPLIPSVYIDRLEISWNGMVVANLTDPPSNGGSMTLPLAPGLMIEPADSALVDVVVDFSATAPVGSIELMIFADGVDAADANLATPVVVSAATGDLFPLVSGLCRLELPPRELVVDLASMMPAALAADGRTVTAGTLRLSNTAPAGSDSILVDHLVLRAADRGLASVPVGTSAGRVEVYRQAQLWAQCAALSPDSMLAVISGGPVLQVPAGEPIDLEVRWTVARSAEAGFRLGVDAAGIGVVQPSSPLLEVRVEAAQGNAFPLWTESGSFSATTLRESYCNFPNPFAAGRETTRFAYFLPAPGRVTLRILMPGGDGVATVIKAEGRAAGMNQTDSWDGRNGRGDVVRNGVYVAELVVSYDSGAEDRVFRKVAVVR